MYTECRAKLPSADVAACFTNSSADVASPLLALERRRRFPSARARAPTSLHLCSRSSADKAMLASQARAPTRRCLLHELERRRRFPSARARAPTSLHLCSRSSADKAMLASQARAPTRRCLLHELERRRRFPSARARAPTSLHLCSSSSADKAMLDSQARVQTLLLASRRVSSSLTRAFYGLANFERESRSIVDFVAVLS
jgi:hypothetical protein